MLRSWVVFFPDLHSRHLPDSGRSHISTKGWQHGMVLGIFFFFFLSNPVSISFKNVVNF